MLADGNLLNIAGPSTRTGHEPHNSNTKRFVLYTYRCPPFPGFFIHATAAAGGALGADPDPALWPVTVPPRISTTRVQPTGTEKRDESFDGHRIVVRAGSARDCGCHPADDRRPLAGRSGAVRQPVRARLHGPHDRCSDGRRFPGPRLSSGRRRSAPGPAAARP